MLFVVILQNLSFVCVELFYTRDGLLHILVSNSDPPVHEVQWLLKKQSQDAGSLLPILYRYPMAGSCPSWNHQFLGRQILSENACSLPVWYVVLGLAQPKAEKLYGVALVVTSCFSIDSNPWEGAIRWDVAQRSVYSSQGACRQHLSQ